MFVDRKSKGIDRIGTLLYGSNPRPKYWRACVNARMRSIGLKQAAGSAQDIITRITRLGRGASAEYAFQRR